MTEKHEEIKRLTDHLFRREYGKLVAVLTRLFGAENLDLAEDVVQDSLMEAIRLWPYKGVPENPAGWLYQVSRNKALNIVRRRKSMQKIMQDDPLAVVSGLASDEIPDHLFSEQEIKDDQLRMIFTCCHPSISPDAQIALTLKTLCGFSISEIARAFLTSEETIHKRLVRARQKLRENKVSFKVPVGRTLDKRLNNVLKTLYLLFNEGYYASTGNELLRQELCHESIRLAEIITEHAAFMPKQEVFALLSLMQLNSARFASRLSSEGSMLTLAEQDRSGWNQEMIKAGLYNLEKAAAGNEASVYHILATISAYHCVAPDFGSTDWKGILTLYDHLTGLDNSPLVLLNRAIALSKVKGPDKGIAELEQIKNIPALKTYPLFFSTLAAFYMEINNFSGAAESLEKAIRLSPLPVERELLQNRLNSCKEKINVE